MTGSLCPTICEGVPDLNGIAVCNEIWESSTQRGHFKWARVQVRNQPFKVTQTCHGPWHFEGQKVGQAGCSLGGTIQRWFLSGELTQQPGFRGPESVPACIWFQSESRASTRESKPAREPKFLQPIGAEKPQKIVLMSYNRPSKWWFPFAFLCTRNPTMGTFSGRCGAPIFLDRQPCSSTVHANRVSILFWAPMTNPQAAKRKS